MMKRIIAATLSVLVGAFGYTIVDQAMEDRVTNLESEVVELREEVSKYHPKYTIEDWEGSTTEDYTTSTDEWDDTTTETVGFTGIQVGDYLYESSNSIRKFLIREYNDGRYRYIPSHNYEPVSLGQKLTTTKGFNDTTVNSYGDIQDGFDETTRLAEQTTQPYATKEYFLYVTDVTAQWTKTEEETSYSYSYDKDYSQVSRKHITEKNYITVKYKGYTDPQLAGTKISFAMYGYYDDYSWQPTSITNNLIDENGYFEFEAIYYRNSYIDNFSIDSIVIK